MLFIPTRMERSEMKVNIRRVYEALRNVLGFSAWGVP